MKVEMKLTGNESDIWLNICMHISIWIDWMLIKKGGKIHEISLKNWLKKRLKDIHENKSCNWKRIVMESKEDTTKEISNRNDTQCKPRKNNWLKSATRVVSFIFPVSLAYHLQFLFLFGIYYLVRLFTLFVLIQKFHPYC